MKNNDSKFNQKTCPSGWADKEMKKVFCENH